MDLSIVRLAILFLGTVVLSGSAAEADCNTGWIMNLTIKYPHLGQEAMNHFTGKSCTKEEVTRYVEELNISRPATPSGNVQQPQATNETPGSGSPPSSTSQFTPAPQVPINTPSPAPTNPTTTASRSTTSVPPQSSTSQQTSPTSATSTLPRTTITASTAPQSTTQEQTSPTPATSTLPPTTTDDLEKWINHDVKPTDDDAVAQCVRQVGLGADMDDCRLLKAGHYKGTTHQEVHDYVYNKIPLADEDYVYVILESHEFALHGLFLETAELPDGRKLQRRPKWAKQMEAHRGLYREEVRNLFVNSY